IGVRWHAVAIPKADARNQHRSLFRIAEALGDEVAQFMNVKFRCVDDDVRELADRLHHLAFMIEAFAYAEVLADGWRAARFAVAAQQSVFGGFDKNDGDRVKDAEMFEERWQFCELFPFAGVDQERRAREAAFTGGVKLGKNRNQLDG